MEKSLAVKLPVGSHMKLIDTTNSVMLLWSRIRAIRKYSGFSLLSLFNDCFCCIFTKAPSYEVLINDKHHRAIQQWKQVEKFKSDSLNTGEVALFKIKFEGSQSV